MPLSAGEHESIQRLVDETSPARRRAMIGEAYGALIDYNSELGRRRFSRDEHKRAELDIERLVRLDAVETGGGWWFRTKRRLQLVQATSCEGGSFNFLIRQLVDDAAERLKEFVDNSLSLYGSLSWAELLAAIDTNCPRSQQDLTGGRTLNFTGTSVPEFTFRFLEVVKGRRELSVQGQRIFPCFHLTADDARWTCSSVDGMWTRASNASKLLSRTMARKYGATDLTRPMKNLP